MNQANWSQNAMQHLVQTLVAPVDQHTCDTCCDQLAIYTERNQSIAQQYLPPSIQQHLDACVSCAEYFAALDRSFTAVDTNLPVPTPDLGWLQQAPSWYERVSSALALVGKNIQISLNQSLLDGFAALQPAQPALRGETNQPLQLTFTPSIQPLREINLAIYPAEANVCRVRVQVQLHDREWPDLAQIGVHLIAASGRQSSETDVWGEAVFSDVQAADVAGLTLEIELPTPIN
ncbi:hypothetical protein [Herpetosiphon giganteus]|uniref:hypothetical protein n=1 Tax=Herpetosiphon giganteus TaxID=2029754 RepID=UPI00195629F3|nr:hypothetical protein [Herpetosiphon giganteus]MBM7844579.1 hypothetical protein [Herpetosiphon giganteus]